MIRIKEKLESIKEVTDVIYYIMSSKFAIELKSDSLTDERLKELKNEIVNILEDFKYYIKDISLLEDEFGIKHFMVKTEKISEKLLYEKIKELENEHNKLKTLVEKLEIYKDFIKQNKKL